MRILDTIDNFSREKFATLIKFVKTYYLRHNIRPMLRKHYVVVIILPSNSFFFSIKKIQLLNPGFSWFSYPSPLPYPVDPPKFIYQQHLIDLRVFDGNSAYYRKIIIEKQFFSDQGPAAIMI